MDDAGFMSRKLMLVAVAICVLMVVTLLCVLWPALQSVYITFCSTLSGLTGLYLVGNLGSQHIASRAEPRPMGLPRSPIK
jgi:hypothetical protein